MESGEMKIHIIGGGNLGSALAIGLSKFSANAQITVCRRNVQQIQYLEDLNIRVSSDNTLEINQADIIYIFCTQLNDLIIAGFYHSHKTAL